MSQKKQNYFKKNILFIVLISISLLMLTFSSKSAQKNIGHVGYSVVSSVQYGFSSFFGFFGKTVNSISELNKLKKEYKALKLRFDINQTIISDYDSLKKENEQFRNLLGFSEKLQYSYVTSQIISRDPSNLFNNFTISGGLDKGIKKYMPVIAFREDGEYGLIGNIIAVGPFTSHFMPLYSDNCYVSGKIDRFNYQGLISGNNNKDELIEMKYISTEAKDFIKVGDFVETSGQNSIYPKGIKIGTISDISNKDWESSITLTVKPYISFSQIEYVYILKEKIE